MINVIIVDDQELFRLGVRTAIENRHPDLCIAGEAETGVELFSLLAEVAVDILLLDIALPDMSGIDIACRLKKERPEIKILAISAENTAPTVQAMIEAGIEGFISKRHGGVDVFAEAIRTIIQGMDYFGKDISEIMYRIYVSKKKTAEVTSEFTVQEKRIIELCRALNDSIFKETTQKQLSEFQVKYKTAEKELEIERQQTEINSHKTRQFVLTGGLLVAGLLLVMLIYIVALRNRRNRELADANATKDKFFSIISHDLKNPTVAQRDAIRLLLENSAQWDEASLTRYYRKLLKSADGQVDLLYTLLDWAQLQTGRMTCQPAKFDLTAA